MDAGDVATQNIVLVNETLARWQPAGCARALHRTDGERGSAPVVRSRGRRRRPRDAGARGENADFIFRPASPAELPSFAVGIHVRSGAAEFARRLPALAAQVAPNLLLYDVLPLDEVIRRRTLPDVQAAMTVVAIALLFLALSAGLYSLMSVAVTRRTREIGIRVAIGASPRAVLTTLFGRAAVQVGSGILLGTCSCPRS